MEQEEPRQCIKCGVNVNIERTVRLPCGHHICDCCKQKFKDQNQTKRIECICGISHNLQTIEIRDNITIKTNYTIHLSSKFTFNVLFKCFS